VDIVAILIKVKPKDSTLNQSETNNKILLWRH
jgi:hypothetical protein